MLFNVWEENGSLAFEGVKESEHTLAYAKSLLKRNLANFISTGHTQPYPGSELYDIAVRHNLIKNNLRGNWDAWLRDDMYIMDIPGVTEKEMAMMRSKGNLIIASALLKSGNLSIRDFVYLIKKGLKLVEDNVKAFLRGL